MVQIAGTRGVLPEPSKLTDIAAGAAVDVAKALAAGALVRDSGRAVYRYHQAFVDPTGRSVVRKMFVCAVRLEPWSEAVVRPHEATSPAEKTAALTALRTRPIAPPLVLAGYRDAAAEVERAFRRAENESPTLEVTTPDRTTHRLWRVQNAELLGKLRHTFAPKKLVVLDGHDRYEALLAHRDELSARRPLAMYSSANYATMCLVDLEDPTLLVATRTRAIRGGGSSQAALAAAKPYFIIEKLAGAAGDLAKQRAALADTLAHQPALVVAWNGEPDAWKLTLSPDVSPVAAGLSVDRALQRLDPIVADQLFVARALPGAKLDMFATAEEAVAAKPDAIMLLRPITIAQIGHLADIGQVLPAGSTAFSPKLCSALVSSVIEPDEDLV